MFKSSIFYDKYQLVGLPSDIYLENNFVISTSLVQTYFYANCDFIILLKDFY